MADWRGRRAQRRYVRSFRDTLAVRQDARGIAVHLSGALPWYTEHPDVPAYTSSVYDSDRLIDQPLQHTEMAKAASRAGAVEFSVKLTEAGRSFTVYVVEDKP